VREYNENCDRIPEHTRSFGRYIPLDQSVRGESAAQNNNEFGIADQPNLHGPQGAKNNKAAAGGGGQSADKNREGTMGGVPNSGLNSLGSPNFWTPASSWARKMPRRAVNLY
jgi:hypothetical protein